MIQERRENEQGVNCNASYDLVSEVIHHCISLLELKPTLKGRGIRLYLLKGGVTDNWWTYFEIHNPKTAIAHQSLCVSFCVVHAAKFYILTPSCHLWFWSQTLTSVTEIKSMHVSRIDAHFFQPSPLRSPATGPWRHDEDVVSELLATQAEESLSVTSGMALLSAVVCDLRK